MKFFLRSIVALCLSQQVSSFGADIAFLHEFSHSSFAVATSHAASGLLGKYLDTLSAHPLETKMATGATLAVAGDAIAQSREPDKYDQKRAVSFMAFDMCYRALQHKLFPLIVQQCHGQYISGALASTFMAHAVSTDFAAAMERTLASQLGIVPFMYYPVFFALTGAVQGLTVEGAVDRAKKNFLPLMERNLLFWIPVQYVQFAFVEENLQIPFLSVCGLCWTFILSVMAGSTKDYKQEETLPYCVTGMEDECIIPDELFPDASLEDITEELVHEFEDFSHDFEDLTQEITHGIEEISHDVLAVFEHEEAETEEQTEDEDLLVKK